MNGGASVSSSSVRRAALERLQRIEQGGAYVGLAGTHDPEDWGAREERQATEYVSGVTRWRRRLDFILQQFYRGDLDAMEPVLRHILRIGLYDILFLHTPAYAAVSQAVHLAKEEVRRGAGGLVNGVLRAVIRRRDTLPEPDTGDVEEDLSIRHSHPTWMVRRWVTRYGLDATTSLLQWNNARPVYGVRANMLKVTPDAFQDRLHELGVAAEPGRYLPDVRRVQSIQPLLREGLFKEGICMVQDEAAGLVVRLLDPNPGEKILDACAAPGGKAFFAAQLMHDRGEILALDVHEGRLRLVQRGARELGIRIVRTFAADLRAFRPTAKFDRVLLDAPCSGLGVLAKRADLRWNRRPEDFAGLTTLQDALVDAAARSVRPGGILIYGTCTIEPEENEERIRAFLKRSEAFEVESAREFLPPELVTKEGFYASLPWRHGIDGAFAARLRHAR